MSIKISDLPQTGDPRLTDSLLADTSDGAMRVPLEALLDKANGPLDNMFINWNFCDPVNSRKKSEYVTFSGGLAIDGWYARDGGGVVTLTDDGLKLSGNRCVLYQPIARKINVGDSLTFSALVKGPAAITFLGCADAAVTNYIEDWNVLSTTIVVTEDMSFDNAYTIGTPGFVNNSVENGNNHVSVTTDDCWVKAVKLEIGTCQTLASQDDEGEWVIIDKSNYAYQYACCELRNLKKSRINRNLLRNWHMPSVINSSNREVYGNDSTNSINCFDSWLISFGTVALKDGYITVTAPDNRDTWLDQYVNLNAIIGCKVSAALLLGDGSIISGTCYVPEYVKDHYSTVGFNQGAYKYNNSVKIYLQANGYLNTHYFRIIVSSGESIDIVAAKLELGEYQTLACQDADGKFEVSEIPDYAEQYALCNLYGADNKLTGQHINDNILINSDFRSTVNQRGLSEYSSYGYSVDMWSLISRRIKMTVHESELELSIFDAENGGSWPSMAQVVEDHKKYIGKTVTLSALIKNPDGVRFALCVKRLLNGSDNGSPALTCVNDVCPDWTLVTCTGKIPDDTEKMTVHLYVGDSHPPAGTKLYVKAIKLEPGNRQTLAHIDENGNWVLNAPPPDKTLELLKCQRYYINFPSYIILHGELSAAAKGYYLGATLPVEMRTKPAIVGSPSFVARLYNGYSKYTTGGSDYKTGDSVSVESVSGNQCVIRFGVNTAYDSENNNSVITAEVKGLALSAEL